MKPTTSSQKRSSQTWTGEMTVVRARTETEADEEGEMRRGDYAGNGAYAVFVDKSKVCACEPDGTFYRWEIEWDEGQGCEVVSLNGKEIESALGDELPGEVRRHFDEHEGARLLAACGNSRLNVYLRDSTTGRTYRRLRLVHLWVEFERGEGGERCLLHPIDPGLSVTYVVAPDDLVKHFRRVAVP